MPFKLNLKSKTIQSKGRPIMTETHPADSRTREDWLELISKSTSWFFMAPMALQSDQKFLEDAILTNNALFKNLKKSQITSKLMISLAGKSVTILADASSGIRNNPEVIRAWCKESSVYFYDAGPKLKSDIAFILELMEQDGNEPIDIIEASSPKIRRVFASELGVDMDDVGESSEEELWEAARVLRERLASS